MTSRGQQTNKLPVLRVQIKGFTWRRRCYMCERGGGGLGRELLPHPQGEEG